MDPVTLIVSAMVLGVSVGAGDVAAAAVKDAYAALKAQISKRFANSPEGPNVLADFERDPETHEKPFSRQLEASGADKDAEILRLSQEVRELGEAAGVKPKYQVVVAGQAKVGIIGDGGHIDSMN